MPTESWIFIKLFARLRMLIDIKFSGYKKESNMVRKLNHYHNFWLNAEHNCRYVMEPFVGEPDDSSIKTYDDIWSKTSKKGPEPVGDKISNLADGFERYMNGYYFEAKSVGKIQGCDGSKAQGTKRRGIHYKKKRYGRKMIKALHKIARRKAFTRKEARGQ